jgi:hypothetical protein
MAHLPPGMEFPNGPMTVDMLLLASLLLVFVFVMLIIGASMWMQSSDAPQKRRAAPRVPAPRPNGVGHARGGRRSLRHSV